MVWGLAGVVRSGWEAVRRVEVRRLERREGRGMGGPAEEVGREGGGGGVVGLVDLSWRSSSS